MGKVWQISTELWPLIDVRNFVFTLYLWHFLPIFFKLGIRVDIEKQSLGIADG